MPSDMIAVKRSESYGPSVELLYTDTYSWPASLWSLMPIDDHREPALLDPKMAENHRSNPNIWDSAELSMNPASNR